MGCVLLIEETDISPASVRLEATRFKDLLENQIPNSSSKYLCD